MGEGQGLGILGGGYGAAQVAITGASWFPSGWRGVELLVVLGAREDRRHVAHRRHAAAAPATSPRRWSWAASSAARSVARRSSLLHDPRIDPGAFALVGMGTFYGGLAHVPIGSLVMTCELAGSYDLLVPLMLAEGIAFVALRNQTLYPAQVTTKRDSPAHRDDLILDFLKGIRVDEILVKDRPLATFVRETPGVRGHSRRGGRPTSRMRFPCSAADGKLVGVITAEILRDDGGRPDVVRVALADDMMGAPISVRDTDDLHNALEIMIANAMRELLVVDETGKVLGVLDQTEITIAYLAATARRT